MTLAQAALWWPWTLPVTLAGLTVSLGAGVVRGFSGFGYSALTVAGLSLFVSPAAVVPAVLGLEVLASVSMMRGAWRDADRGWLRWLLWGNLVCIPIGIAALALLPQPQLRLLVGLVLLLGALLVRAAGTRSMPTTPRLQLGAGVASGLLNGVAASGGIAAAMLMAAARLPPLALRATMVSFLFFAGAYALACAGLASAGGGAPTRLVSADTLGWALLLAPGMLAGIWIGHRSFGAVNPAHYRRVVLNLLIVISTLGVLRAVFDLWRG